MGVSGATGAMGAAGATGAACATSGATCTSGASGAWSFSLSLGGSVASAAGYPPPFAGEAGEAGEGGAAAKYRINCSWTSGSRSTASGGSGGGMTRPRMGRRWGRRPQAASGSKCWARASRNKQRSISTGICSYQASMMPNQRPSCWKTSGSAETAALIWSLCFAKALRKRRRRNGATWPATWKDRCQEGSVA